jgi:hypothetical protein
MKNRALFCSVMLTLLLSTLNHQFSTCLAQGSLTPTGAPGATMKSLDQIESRTPIASAPFTISAPGSYYLTTNLTVSSGDAITIAASGVTLDLGGWTIISTTASATGYGIQLNSGLHDLAIFNGHILSGVTNNGSGVYGGPGFANGISYSGAAPVNTRVTGVSVSGCLSLGISLGYGDSTVVESCTARTVGSYGIDASTIKGSVAEDCGLYAIIGDQVSDCRGQITGSGSGVFATTANNSFGSSSLAGTTGLYAKNAINCSGVCSSSGYGVLATASANNCSGSSINDGDGVYAGASALNCYGSSTGTGNGVYAADVAQNCYGSSLNGYGVYSGSIANSCVGYSTGGVGLYSAHIAQNSYGQTSGGIGVDGLHAVDAAINCAGSSPAWQGVEATVAIGCTGYSGSNYGVYANNIAVACVGTGPNGAHGAHQYDMP